MVIALLGSLVPYGTEGERAAADVTLEWKLSTEGTLFSTPALYDLSGNGNAEIIVASEDDHIYCVDSDGNVKWSSPVLYNDFELASILSSPAVSDVSGDGSPEIIIGSDDGLLCLDPNGKTIWAYTGSATRYISSPAVDDLDGDGNPEIVAGSVGDYMVKSFDATGNMNWKFATGFGDFDAAVLSSPTIADINGDGIKEALIGTHNSVVLALDTKGELQWNYEAGHTNFGSPSVADLNGDGEINIISGSDDRSFYSFDTRGGKLWDVVTDEPVLSSPSIGDLDGDGNLETIFGSDDGNIYSVGADGFISWKFETGGRVRSSPALGDVNGDGNLEVVVGSNDGYVYCIDHSGELVWKYKTGGPIRYASPTLGDIDRDGKMEVVVGSTDGNLYCLESPGTVETGTIEWGMFKHDLRHTGLYSTPMSFAPKDRELSVSDVSIPSDIEKGQEVIITVSVSNDGADNAYKVPVSLAINGQVVAQSTIAKVQGGETVETEVTWFATDSGDIELKITVDGSDMIDEDNESDNTETRTVSVANLEKEVDSGEKKEKGGIIPWFWLLIALVVIIGIIIAVSYTKRD